MCLRKSGDAAAMAAFGKTFDDIKIRKRLDIVILHLWGHGDQQGELWCQQRTIENVSRACPKLLLGLCPVVLHEVQLSNLALGDTTSIDGHELRASITRSSINCGMTSLLSSGNLSCD